MRVRLINQSKHTCFSLPEVFGVHAGMLQRVLVERFRNRLEAPGSMARAPRAPSPASDVSESFRLSASVPYTLSLAVRWPRG